MTGPELKAAIKALGCTQGEFARHCGMAQEHLSRMCTGHRPVQRWLEMLITEWQGPHPVNPPPKRFRIPQESAKPDDVHKTC